MKIKTFFECYKQHINIIFIRQETLYKQFYLHSCPLRRGQKAPLLQRNKEYPVLLLLSCVIYFDPSNNPPGDNSTRGAGDRGGDRRKRWILKPSYD